MKIKHVLASKKDKKPTIQNGEMKKIIGDTSSVDNVTLFYPELKAIILYHKSRNGQSWYGTNSFENLNDLPKVGNPKTHEVERLVVTTPQPKMELDLEFQPIRDWADERGIYQKGDIKTQYLKLLEEVGELSKAILKNDKAEFIDAIGDCVVVLTNLAELGANHFSQNCKYCQGTGGYFEDVAGDGGPKLFQTCEECYGFTIEDCINSAYEVIAKRKGAMVNGTFVKSK